MLDVGGDKESTHTSAWVDYPTDALLFASTPVYECRWGEKGFFRMSMLVSVGHFFPIT